MNKFGISNRDLANKDILLEFQYSKGALRESIHNQKNSYNDLAKLLTVLPEVSANAIAIECHDDRYKGTIRESHDLKMSYNLIGVFKENNHLIPVKLMVKEVYGQKNKLYITITAQKIKS